MERCSSIRRTHPLGHNCIGGVFDHSEFFSEFFVWHRKQRVGWALSLNGPDGDEQDRIIVPVELFDEQFELSNVESR